MTGNTSCHNPGESNGTLDALFKIALVLLSVAAGASLMWLTNLSRTTSEHEKKLERFEEWKLTQKEQNEEHRKRLESFEKSFTELSLRFGVFQERINADVRQTAQSLQEALGKLNLVGQTVSNVQEKLGEMNQKIGNIYNLLDSKPVMDAIKEK